MKTKIQKKNKDWEVKKLGKLCEVSIGKTPFRGNAKFWDKQKHTKNVWLSIADLKKGDGRIVDDSLEYISDIGAELCNIIKKETLLVSFKLTLGRLAFAGRDLYTNEAIAALGNDESEVLNDYLYHYLTFFDWNDYAKSDHKVKGKTLNKTKVKNIPVFYPDIPEQKHIVKILDEKFGEIEKLRKITEKQVVDVKELFESRLNGVFEALFENFEFKQMEELYDVRDGTHDSPKYKSDGYPLITSKNLKYGEINFDKINYISEKDYININKRSLVDIGDVLFAMIGTIGNPAVVVDEPKFAIKNVALFKLNKGQDGSFLKYYLKSHFVIEKMKMEAKGTTQKFVGLGYLRSFPIINVPLKKQKEVAKELDVLGERTRELEAIFRRKIASLEELKKSLLKQAFSGEL